MNRPTGFKFPNLTRSCGHREDAESRGSYGHEPTVRQWEQDKLCAACAQVKRDAVHRTEARVKAAAHRWLTAHGIDPTRPSCTVFNDGIAVEITLVLNANDLQLKEQP